MPVIKQRTSVMKIAVVLLLVGVLVICAASPSPAGDKYSDRFDKVDLDSILSNERMLKAHIECILDNGPCTPEAAELKSKIPEGLSTSCEKCTDNQKKLVRKGSKYIMEKRPDDWKRIAEYYDKEGKYVESFQKFLDEKD